MTAQVTAQAAAAFQFYKTKRTGLAASKEPERES